MKTLTYLPVALMLSFPVTAQERVVITFADGTTKSVNFDEVLELPGAEPALTVPAPVVAGPVAPSVSVTTGDTGVVANISIAPVIGQDGSTTVIGQDAGSPVSGDAPETRVTVGITEPAPPKPPAPAPAPPTPKITEMSFPGMNFETNKYTITFDGMKRVAYVAQIMFKYQDLRIMVTGHTDNVGSEEENLILSQNRAKSFSNALSNRYGIDPQRITWHGVGESEPSHPNSTEEGRYANRRIVITPLDGA
ncbi:Outer membrane protein OmpA [Roseovarius marisflavi]|uniref:Outer membrane protein OmpA n=1 Tax=Roseovarius marisflavi TaxID=1054996 RepID=A0A1M7DRR9_9RHOB|nr:OmpA family protein [Roseovarius marisflavi]SHL82194.1 Outer membrane protein OmpA [Roseovarius marisflavi]